VSESPPILSCTESLTNFPVREAQLRPGRSSGAESVSQLKGMTIDTPLTPPHDKRGSERLMKRAATEGRMTYNDMAGTGKRKRKKRKSGHGLKSMDQQPRASRSNESGTSSDGAPQRTPSRQTHQTVRHDCFKSTGQSKETHDQLLVSGRRNQPTAFADTP
jgi:hypothetical protein